MATTNGYVDAKMAAQHREIERLIESRQRLHTIKDQIASLHQSMATPTVPSAKGTFSTGIERSSGQWIDCFLSHSRVESTNDVRADSSRRARMQSDNLNDSGNYRSGHQSFTRPPEVDDDNDSELYHFEYDSGDGEEIDDDTGKITPRILDVCIGQERLVEEEIPARTKQDVRGLRRSKNSIDQLSSFVFRISTLQKASPLSVNRTFRTDPIITRPN